MLTLSRMKSFLNLSPTLSNNVTTPFSCCLHSEQSIIFRKISRNMHAAISLQSPNFLSRIYVMHSLVNCAKPSNGNRIRSLHTEAASRSGEIHVIVGPMFAGKTTTLLRRIKLESSNGRNVAIIKSNKDTRYAVDSIVTHDGEKLPCWPLAELSSFRERLGPEAYNKLEVIGIDEAQFFEDLYEFCGKAADHDGKTIIVAGLDGDYLRRSFGAVLDIIPIADSVTKLTARCELCGERAFFTLRKTDESETELIAGAEVYMPVCRKHYVSGQVVKVAARTVLETQKVQCNSIL